MKPRNRKFCKYCGREYIRSDFVDEYNQKTGKPTKKKFIVMCPEYGISVYAKHDRFSWREKIK